MRAYTIAFTLVLNFATLASYFIFTADLPFAQQVLALKDITLACGVLLILPSLWKRLTRLVAIDWFVLLVIACNVVAFILSDAPVADRIFNLRRDISFILVLMIFREHGLGFHSELSYFQFLKPILVVLWAFGIVEFLLPDAFWNDVVHITSYWDALSVDPFSTTTIGQNGRFYSWDLVPIAGAVRRMVSFYFEPTTIAAFFVACLCFSLIGGRRERFWTALISGLGLLTISKFFALSVPLAILAYVLRNRLHKWLFLGFISGCIVLSALVLVLDIDAGALAHLKGISSLVEIVMQDKWLGLGLGAGGNYADADLDSAEIGAESGFGNIAAQLGVMSVGYIFLLNSLYTTLLARYWQTRDPIFAAAVAALVCWTLSFFLSASSLGLSGNAFIFILIGSVLHRRKLPLEGTVDAGSPPRPSAADENAAYALPASPSSGSISLPGRA